MLYYTYPKNSTASQELNGTVIWLNATSYLNASGRQSLEEDMNSYQSHDESTVGSSNNPTNSTSTNSTHNNTTQPQPVLHVVNATLTYQLHAFANQTNLTVYRNLTINLKISNITKTEGNNTTVIDMSWRAFGIQGELMSDFRGKLELLYPSLGINIQSDVNTNMDVNMLGDLSFGEGGSQMWNFQMGTLFEDNGFGANVMNFNTINFHVFAVPLNQWTRVYDSSTNSTTFYYNTSTNFSLNASLNNSGNIYTIKVKTDPQAAFTTNGNAQATSANELVVSNAAAPGGMLSAYSLPIIGAVLGIIIIGLAAAFVRKRSKKQ